MKTKIPVIFEAPLASWEQTVNYRDRFGDMIRGEFKLPWITKPVAAMHTPCGLAPATVGLFSPSKPHQPILLCDNQLTADAWLELIHGEFEKI